MEEGSMRCDANISVMPKDSNVYGQRVEVKNMNSIKNVQLAIEYEIERQIGIISQGQEIIPETRMFDSQKCTTKFQRLKEKAADSKYFQEPDRSGNNEEMGSDHLRRGAGQADGSRVDAKATEGRSPHHGHVEFLRMALADHHRI